VSFIAQNFASSNKIEALLWISRLMTVFSTFNYFLPIAGYGGFFCIYSDASLLFQSNVYFDIYAHHGAY